PRSTRTIGQAVLNVSELSSPGVADGTLTLHRGEIFGIAGLLGSGRTPLLRTLFGLEAVRSGVVRLGAYVGPFSPALRWRQGMGLLSENRTGEGLALNLSIADNMTLTRLDGLGPAFVVWPAHQDRAAHRWITALAICASGPRQAVSELCGGNKQRVALARHLRADVDVLLLDEPTRGIDVPGQERMYAVVDALVSVRRPGPFGAGDGQAEAGHYVREKKAVL